MWSSITKNNKEIRKWIVFNIVLIFIIINMVQWSKHEHGQTWFHQVLPEKCGTVENRFTELQQVKHGTKTEYWMQIRYDNGTKEITAVSGGTWYGNPEGERVCFSQQELIPWGQLIALLCTCVIGIIVITIIISLIVGWIWPGEGIWN